MGDMISRGDALALIATECLLDEAAIAALPAVTVGVRPLVWEDRIGRIVCEADTVVGVYLIARDGVWIALWFDGSRASGALPSIEAAKAAAQADYEARILAALEPQPAPDAQAIREAALREAHDAIADYPRTAPDGMEAQHYDEQIEHSQAIILALIGTPPVTPAG